MADSNREALRAFSGRVQPVGRPDLPEGALPEAAVEAAMAVLGPIMTIAWPLPAHAYGYTRVRNAAEEVVAAVLGAGA